MLQVELGSECGVDEWSLLLEVVFRSGGVALILPSHHASHLYILISFGLFKEKKKGIKSFGGNVQGPSVPTLVRIVERSCLAKLARRAAPSTCDNYSIV